MHLLCPIPEAMMMEPTESETKETLDDFANTLIEIDQKITDCPENLLNSPVSCQFLSEIKKVPIFNLLALAFLIN